MEHAIKIDDMGVPPFWETFNAGSRCKNDHFKKKTGSYFSRFMIYNQNLWKGLRTTEALAVRLKQGTAQQLLYLACPPATATYSGILSDMYGLLTFYLTYVLACYFTFYHGICFDIFSDMILSNSVRVWRCPESYKQHCQCCARALQSRSCALPWE